MLEMTRSLKEIMILKICINTYLIKHLINLNKLFIKLDMLYKFLIFAIKIEVYGI